MVVKKAVGNGILLQSFLLLNNWDHIINHAITHSPLTTYYSVYTQIVNQYSLIQFF